MIISKKQFSADWAFVIANVIGFSSLSAASLPADILPQLNASNETWTSPTNSNELAAMTLWYRQPAQKWLIDQVLGPFVVSQHHCQSVRKR